MRDVFLLSFLPYLLYLIFRAPFTGAALWIWTALFVPGQWMWGMATGLRYNFIVVLVTIVSYLIHIRKTTLIWSGTATIAMMFYFWFSLSAANAISATDMPTRWWDTFSRIIALFVFCHLVLIKKLHWDVFIWAIVLAIGGYGMLEACKFVLSGFAHEIVGMGGQILDRNDLALVLNVTIPLAGYLRSQARHKVLRTGLLLMIALLCVAVIGTQSRGGLVALVVLALLFLISSGRRFLPAVVSLGLLALALSFVMTDSYKERAATLGNVEEDASFVGRLSAWKLSIYIALDRPFLGGGPFAVQTPDVGPRYEGVYDPEQWFETASFEHATRAAHSIYFQVLGDTGFVGLALYMAMLGSAGLKMIATGRRAKRAGNQDVAMLAKSLFFSLAAYMVGGAALSAAYFDLLFGLLALMSIVGARGVTVVAEVSSNHRRMAA